MGRRARTQALATVALPYGALTLARAAGPARLSDELLAAAKSFLADALPEEV